MNENWQKKAQELAGRPYFMRVALDETTDDKPVYLAHVPELEGCFGQGETPEAAVADLRLAMVDLIASLLEDGVPVPEPTVLVTTTGSTINKTFTISNQEQDKNIELSNPHRNIYVPAG